MGSESFKYALLPLSMARESAEWLTDDINNQFTSVDILDFPQNLAAQTFSLYERTYQRYADEADNQLFSQSWELYKYNRWILFYEDDDPDKIVALFALFNTTSDGLKGCLTGSNGARDCKKSLIILRSIPLMSKVSTEKFLVP